jgi:outer membrane protein insertion porin family
MVACRIWSLAGTALVVALASACVEETANLRLASLEFDGVRQVSERELRRTLATKAPGRWPWSRDVPFSEPAFRQDLDRIRLFYVDRGYPDAVIDSVQTTFNDTRTAVSVRVTIAEGQPLKIDRVAFSGFEAVERRTGQPFQPDAIGPGSLHDRAGILAVRQTALELLRNNGFAYGTVEIDERPSGPGLVAVDFRAVPGPETVFGPVTVEGLVKIDEAVIRRQLSIRTGARYNARLVTVSQRRISALEALQFVNVDAAPPESRPIEIPVRVTVAEDKLRRLRIGLGYGAEERARGSIEWSHLNFFGDARRASIAGRWSSIERGITTTFLQPYLLRPGMSIEARAASRWLAERIYTASEYGGRIGVAYRFRAGVRGVGRGLGDRIAAAYVHEYLRHDVRPDVLLSGIRAEQLLALGFDPIDGRGRGTRAGVSIEYERTNVDNVANPRSGYSVSAHGTVAGRAFGGTYRYREARAEARAYLPLGGHVLAARAGSGLIAARSDADVPVSQRYFLGGSSSLRGWSRYQVAPLVEGVPVGGLRMIETALEWRMPLTGKLGASLFLEGGAVGASALARRTRWLSDAGIGVRYTTPVGLIRADLAFQLRPLEGVDSTRLSETRPWRVHFGIGNAF